MDILEKLDLIYAVILDIPRGRVATYGQIADLAGLPRNARLVGRALRTAPEDADLPWHRVVNHTGRVSDRNARTSERDQRRLLEAEGIVFRGDRVVLDACRWDPDHDR